MSATYSYNYVYYYLEVAFFSCTLKMFDFGENYSFLGAQTYFKIFAYGPIQKNIGNTNSTCVQAMRF